MPNWKVENWDEVYNPPAPEIVDPRSVYMRPEYQSIEDQLGYGNAGLEALFGSGFGGGYYGMEQGEGVRQPPESSQYGADPQMRALLGQAAPNPTGYGAPRNPDYKAQINEIGEAQAREQWEGAIDPKTGLSNKNAARAAKHEMLDAAFSQMTGAFAGNKNIPIQPASAPYKGGPVAPYQHTGNDLQALMAYIISKGGRI